MAKGKGKTTGHAVEESATQQTDGQSVEVSITQQTDGQAVEDTETQKLINDAVEFINNELGNTLYSASIKIGNYILDKFFDNDIELAKSKNPHKSISYNKLQNHPDLKIHLNQLNLMVRAAIQDKYLDENTLKDEKNKGKEAEMLLQEEKDALTFSHCVELLRLDDNEHKILLAKQAVAKDKPMSVRALRIEVNKQLEKEAEANPKIEKPGKEYIKLDNSLVFIADNYSTIVNTPNVDDLKKLSKKQLTSMKSNIENFLKIKHKDIEDNCKALITTIDNVLKDKPKSGRPPKVTE